MREALAAWLCGVPGLSAVDCGRGNAESIDRARDLGVDLVLIELDVRAATSFALALGSTARRICAVALLCDEGGDVIPRLTKVGVAGFVEPDAGLAACVRTIRSFRRRGFEHPQEFSTSILQATEKSSVKGLSISALRGRQLEVAECLASGLSNKDIGIHLRIAEGTVKNHVHAVLAALGVQHRWDVAGALRGVPPESRPRPKPG